MLMRVWMTLLLLLAAEEEILPGNSYDTFLHEHGVELKRRYPERWQVYPAEDRTLYPVEEILRIMASILSAFAL